MPNPLLESFIRETSDLVGKTSDPKLVVDHVAENVRRLLAGPFFLDERYQSPSREAFSRHVIHSEPGSSVLVVTCVWTPQQSTPIHDHLTWGVIAGLTGRIIATTYRRLDDGQVPGFASITETTRTLVSETSFASIRPP